MADKISKTLTRTSMLSSNDHQHFHMCITLTVHESLSHFYYRSLFFFILTVRQLFFYGVKHVCLPNSVKFEPAILLPIYMNPDSPYKAYIVFCICIKLYLFGGEEEEKGCNYIFYSVKLQNQNSLSNLTSILHSGFTPIPLPVSFSSCSVPQI